MQGRGDLYPGGLYPGGVCIWGRGLCIRGEGGLPHPSPGYYGIRSTRGQYASYWNAFLFIFGRGDLCWNFSSKDGSDVHRSANRKWVSNMCIVGNQ